MFIEPVDLRAITETITDEEVLIPAVSPYQVFLNEVPSSTEGVKIRRITPVAKTGTGTGEMTAQGHFTGLATRNYLIEIDEAGGLGVATFRWSIDDGLTWRSTGIPIPDEDPIDIELGLQIRFSDGTYVLGDQFEFTAQYWEEVETVPIATKTFQVNYANGLVTFYSADAGLAIEATYEGRGSIVKARDVQQLIDAFNRGAVTIGKVDTSELSQKKGVRITVTGVFAVASSDEATTLAIGFCKTVDAEAGEIVLFGPMGGFSGLAPGTLYYLGADGSPSDTPGVVSQKVGRALSDTILIVNCEP